MPDPARRAERGTQGLLRPGSSPGVATRPGVATVLALAVVLGALVAGGVTTAAGASSARERRASRLVASSSRPVRAVGAENEYASVIGQIGGRYVSVVSVLDSPSTDPHSFEPSPSVAREVSAAQLVVQNGLGYDTFMNRIESASPSSARKVIVVQDVLGLPDSTPNPHLWYDPTTMAKVATAIASDLSSLEPRQAAYFRSELSRFERSLQPLDKAIAAFKSTHKAVPAATTEPVADYLLAAMGVRDLTPFGFQADVMNGIDPSPQDISLEDGLFATHKVKFFCYNEQVVDALTSSMRQAAIKAGIPVVGVYETMPTPGYDYQSWMLAEVHAIDKAVTSRVSTEKL